jgi:hypothetical protein
MASRSIKKAQRKRPHCYHYAVPIIFTDNNLQRLGSNSPFQYSRQVKTIDEKTKNSSENQVTSSSSSSNTDENKQDKSIKKKSLQTLSSLIHRKDSHRSLIFVII